MPLRIHAPAPMFAVLAAVVSAPVGAQDVTPACADGAVASVEVVTHSIYVDDDFEGGRFKWALRLVNRFHFTTRPGVVEAEVVVRARDCFTPELVRESLRLLRALPYIARAEAFDERQSGGAHAIRFETWDEWSTGLGLNVSIEDEVRFEGAFLSERNLLGRGLSARLVSSRRREQRDLGVGLAGTALFGSRLDWGIDAGDTRNGWFVRPMMRYPFVGERGRVDFDFRGDARDHDRVYATGWSPGAPSQVSHVLLPVTSRALRVSLLRRLGRPGALGVFGGEVDVLRRTVAGDVRTAVANDFGTLGQASDSLVGALGPLSEPASWVRVGVTGGGRRISFRTASGLDLVHAEQDVAVGSEWSVTMGRTLATWGGGGHDSYGRLEGFAGHASDRSIVQATVWVEGHVPDAVAPAAPKVRDLVAKTRLRGYLKAGPASPLTTYVELGFEGAWWEGGRRSDDVVQLTLGGVPGVRSLVDYEMPVSRRLVMRLEERWNLRWFGPAAEVGLTLFGDLGRGWGGDTPFSSDTDWRAAVGGGLRLGFPSGSGSNLRLEFARSATRTAGGGAVLRAYWVSAGTSR